MIKKFNITLDVDLVKEFRELSIVPLSTQLNALLVKEVLEIKNATNKLTQEQAYGITGDILAKALGQKECNYYVEDKMELCSRYKWNIKDLNIIFDKDTIENLSDYFNK